MRLSIFFLLLSLMTLSYSGFGQHKKFSKDMLENPRTYENEFRKIFNINEVKVFHEDKNEQQVIMENGYVQYNLKNKDQWPAYNPKVVVTQIDIIFTKYPKEISYWRTNYYELLANRIKAILAIDSTLNSDVFEWNLVMQTECNTELQAKKMFHGVAITYFNSQEFEDEPDDVSDKNIVRDSVYFAKHTLKVKNYIRSHGGDRDSLISRIFERNKDWKNALVVMDWTGSMYQYGAEAVQWHTLNFETSGIQNFVFFNDGNNTEDHRKKIGYTGGVYYAHADNLDRLIKTFYLVGSRGDGGDRPENDIEGLIRGKNRFEDFDELVLIADNNSCMRDFSLLVNLDVAVNIIVCGAEHGINPQYVNLAYHTGGSIHTIEEDIHHLSSLVKSSEIKLQEMTYSLNNDLFEVKNPYQALRFKSCDEFTTLFPVAPEPRLAFIEKHGGIEDSTVYKVLQRHPAWDNSVVIMDWTKEMYTSSAQAVLFHKLNRKTSGITSFVFFNDGDRKSKHKKKKGRTGGVYHSKSNNLSMVTRRFEYVVKRGNGGDDDANNDIEAIIKAAQRYKDAEQLIIVADNNTYIRDIKLLKYIDVPIKIILSNVKGPINPQYINLAYRSGGSLHTIDDDIYNHVFKTTKESESSLKLNNVEYVVGDDDTFVFKSKERMKNYGGQKYDNPNLIQRFIP